MSALLVWQVFRDPALDYRLVAAAAVAPDVVDGALGGARFLHTLLAAVATLFAVMLLTRRRRPARRRLLAVPIGLFCHLLLDGVWTDRHLFWWPSDGAGFAGRRLPSLDRPLLLVIAMEAVGLAALVWSWRRVADVS